MKDDPRNLQGICDDWNTKYPPGTPVRAWIANVLGVYAVTFTESVAFVLSGNRAVVYLAGKGLVELDRVEANLPHGDRLERAMNAVRGVLHLESIAKDRDAQERKNLYHRIAAAALNAADLGLDKLPPESI